MTRPAHLTLLSPIPEEERSKMIRDVFTKPWGSEKPDWWRGNVPSSTVEGFAQWKRDVADQPSERHPDWPKTCRCGAPRCYADQYCTNASCPHGQGIEGMHLLYAIKANDLIETLRFSLVLPGLSVDDLAEFVRGAHYGDDAP